MPKRPNTRYYSRSNRIEPRNVRARHRDGCESLTSIEIPDTVTSIGEGVFSGCDNLTLTVPRDSYVKQYCIDNGLKYTYADSLDWLTK